jgi:hypothetical protein
MLAAKGRDTQEKVLMARRAMVVLLAAMPARAPGNEPDVR